MSSTLPPPDGRGGEDAPFDFLMAGAGAAGLLLARRLAETFPDASLCLVDPSMQDLVSRTFAFWCAGAPPMPDAVSRTWERVRIATPARTIERSLDAHRYHVIEGARFREAAIAGLAGRAFHSPARVTALEPIDGATRVVTSRGPLYARWVFDSRLDLEAVPADPALHVALTQRFTGWEVETDAPRFDPDVITLFDFRVAQGNGDVRFVYVLPFDERRALVEHVAHHRYDGAPDDLARYAADVLQLGDPRVVRREGGTSPLTDAPFPRRAGPRTLRIGVAGGRLKPSSGYAFLRMHDDARAIAASLREHGHPFALPPERPAFRLLDGLMLRVMKTRPERMGDIFLRMFAQNPADRVLAFLDESVGWDDVLALGSSLPPGPFAEQLGASLRKRLRRALRRLVEPPIEGEEPHARGS
ncbi:MAG: lycopene cyclase family protein [Sandaracinaceae bacterium]